jgi:hypothetical protein
MKLATGLVFVVLCFSAHTYAAIQKSNVTGEDSLVFFRELTFYSEFEKETFDRYRRRDTDLFAFFMANGNLLGETKIREQKNMFYRYLHAVGYEKTANKKNDKRIKFIYDNLHSKFLTKYELKNRFEEVFYNGYYNCVSATALYALAFEDLAIPYSIKEEPTHVYLVAYPDAERIMLQTTLPQAGYITLSDEFKQAFVKRLKDQKLISSQEYAAKSIAELFDEYYFGKGSNISLLNLAGLQYSNDALYKFDDKKFEEAFTQLEKAYILYPSERVAYLLMIAGTGAFEAHHEKDSTHAVLLGKLARYKAYGVEPENIVSEFSRVTQQLLFESGKKEEYDRYYRILTGSLRQEKLKNDIAFLYYYENGRLLYNKAKYRDALPYLEKTLTVKPSDLNTQGLLLAALSQTLHSKNNNQDAIKLLEDYTARFPELETNNHFNALKGTAYLVQFHMSYSTGKIAEGDRYKVLFEGLATKYPDIVINPDLIGQSYSSAAVYYYRKGQTTKAKQMLATGLRYAPNNYELIARQQMIH